MPPKKKLEFIPKTIIKQTPTFMRLGSRDKSILTFATYEVFAGVKTAGYNSDTEEELNRIIYQAADSKVRLALINLALPPLSHVFMIMKLDTELRVYDVQNSFTSQGIPTHYDDYSGEFYDCSGYRFFLNGLLKALNFSKEQLIFMPSPELSKEEWEIIYYCADNGECLPGENRGPCLLWCDAVLNRHWKILLSEAYESAL